MASKVLYIGDVHATLGELEECKALLGWVDSIVSDTKPDSVVFLGDQLNDFDVLSIRTIGFWREWLGKLGGKTLVYLLVGNHDRIGPRDRTEANAMATFDSIQGVVVVDRPTMISNGILAIPYADSPEQFLSFVATDSDQEVKTLICHQAFNGAKYDNGFFVKDGVPMETIPPSAGVISGHIHKPAAFGSIWYPGSPRWRTMNDVNVDRHIYLVTHDESGGVSYKTAIPTDEICRRIWRFDESQDAPLDPSALSKVRPQDKVVVFVSGSPSFVRSRCSEIRTLGHEARPCVTQGAQVAVRESCGVDDAFGKFIEAYKPLRCTPVEKLKEMVSERIYG